MEKEWMFCTIETKPECKEFDCTVFVDKNGCSGPKDVWCRGEWTPIKKFNKEITNNYDVYGYRNIF